MAEQEVRIEFFYELDDAWAQFFAWEKRLEALIKNSRRGKYDFHELEAGGGAGTLFMYGPDADALLDIVLPLLRTASFMKNAVATLTYGAIGEPGVRTARISLSVSH